MGFALALCVPVVPVSWLLATGRAGSSSAEACATGPTCITCEPNNCWLGYNELYAPTSTYTNMQRCVQKETNPPGLCGVVFVEIRTVIRYYETGWTNQRTCVIQDCLNPSYTRYTCPNPYVF